jgi:hypothetical protein
MGTHYLVTHDGMESTTTYDPTGRFGDNATWVMVDSETQNTEWLIDIGPFFDRFGAAQITVLAHPDAQVQAVVKSVMARKWISLKRPDVAVLLDLVISKGIAGVDAALKDAILNTPVRPEENLALRKTYFNFS